MKLKGFYVGAAVCAMVAGVALGTAGPAAADPPNPPNTLAGAGSDTIQDVLNALALSIGPKGHELVGSWDAFQPGSSPIVTHDAITPKNTVACTGVSRPNGSGEGVAALRLSLAGTSGFPSASLATYPGSKLPTPGSRCFDFARSSSGPGTNASATGYLQYVPFALDGVTLAVGPASGTNATNIHGSFTLAQLQAMYKNGTPEVASDGVTYDPYAGDGVTGTPIDLLIPQPGSGTRSFFAGVVGINATTLPDWVSDHYTPTAGGASQAVEEHDGTAVQQDRNAIMPFSTAQWIAQASGHNDRRHGAVLETVDGVQPVDNSGKLNESFPGALLREVYNVIPFSATTATGTDLYNVFVSPSTLNPQRLCNLKSLITEYGFGLLDSAPKGHTCGQIDPAFRAFDDTKF